MSKIRKAFKYLKEVRKATSLQISHAAGITVALGSMMGDLRKRGCDIIARFLHTTQDGAQVWEYEILSWPIKSSGFCNNELAKINEARWKRIW